MIVCACMLRCEDIRDMLHELKETRMISGTGAYGDGVHVDEEQAGGATTRRVVRPSHTEQYSTSGGVRFENPDISYVACAIEADVRGRGFHGQSIHPEKTVDVGGIAVYTYRLTADNLHDWCFLNTGGGRVCVFANDS